MADSDSLSTGLGIAGAGAGAFFGGPQGALAGGGIGMQLGSIFGGSSAAQRAAKERERAAQAWQKQVAQDKEQALSLIGTPAQMAAHDQALQAQERQVQRQETLAQSINPALVEAGKQYHQLLMGKQAPVLQQMSQNRQLQRQQLIDQLHNSLGPGAETSSAGMNALQKFDNETANMMSQTQMQYTSMLGNEALSAPGAMNAFGGANANLAEINQMSPDAQKARMIAQFSGLQGAANEANISAAGAGQVGAALQNQGIANLGSSLTTLAGGMAGKESLKGGTQNTDPTIDRSGGRLTATSGPTLSFSTGGVAP